MRDPPDEDYGKDTPEGVSWRHHSWYDQERPFDLFIAWRYGMSLHIGRRSRRAFLWLQDLVGRDSLPPPVLSAPRPHHGPRGVPSGRSSEPPQIPRLGRGGGCLTSPKSSPTRLWTKICFVSWTEPTITTTSYTGSNPTRGLENILQVWPRIRDALAERGRAATLHVYYGFPDKVVTQLRAQMGPAVFEAFYERVTTPAATGGSRLPRLSGGTRPSSQLTRMQAFCFTLRHSQRQAASLFRRL
jgi:hypothetical protein